MDDNGQTLENQGPPIENTPAPAAPQVAPEAQPQPKDVFAFTQKNAAPTPAPGEKVLPAWVSQFKGPLQKEEAFHQYQTLSDFGTAHLEQGNKFKELETKMKDAMFFPGDEATDEEVNAFLTKLGRPESAEGYDLSLAEELAGFEVSPENSKELSQLFHKCGLSKGQANHLFNALAKQSVERAKVNTQASKATEEGLKTTWGKDYEPNLELSRRAMQRYYPDLKKLDEKGLGNDPEIVQMFHKIGVELGEDRLHFGTEGRKKGGLESAYNS